jgi:5-formyltetrahydrofolate cyclo-ligase
MGSSSGRGDADPAQGAALREAKFAMRRQVLARRDAVPAEGRAAASVAIAARILALSEFASAEAVLLTLPFGSEWDTLPVVRAALAAGKTVAVPRVDAQARMLALHAISDPRRDIIAGYQGIPEPLRDCPRVARDAIRFVLVPGVAFDLAGRRLGYGGGYYDRLLPLLSPGVARVVGALEIQLVDRVPTAPHDLLVDAIVTESRLLTLRP